MKKIVSFLMIVVSIACALQPLKAAAATTDYLIITKEGGSPIWSKPTKHSTQLGTLPKDSLVQAIGSAKNEYGNYWYMLSNGSYIYSGNVKMHDCETGVKSNLVGKSYVDNADGTTHTMAAAFDNLCVHGISVGISSQKVIEPHSFGEDKKCQCGAQYVHICTPAKTDVNIEYADNHDGTHRIVKELLTRCSCGRQLGDAHYERYDEIHKFENTGNGRVCSVCGLKEHLCAAAQASFLKNEYTFTNDGHLKKTYYENYCSCGKELGVTILESIIEPHDLMTQYTSEHPHYLEMSCSKCNYTETEWNTKKENSACSACIYNKNNEYLPIEVKDSNTQADSIQTVENNTTRKICNGGVKKGKLVCKENSYYNTKSHWIVYKYQKLCIDCNMTHHPDEFISETEYEDHVLITGLDGQIYCDICKANLSKKIDELADVRSALAVCGMVGFEICDVVDMFISHKEGEGLLLNIISIVPFAGALGGAAKVAKNVEKTGDIAGSVTTYAKTLWKKVDVGGITVYQRNDIIDINYISSWTYNGKTYTGTNLQRMLSGRAPIGIDAKSVVLHHGIQNNSSTLFELTGSFHSKNHRVLHINIGEFPSGINRSSFATYRRNYWQQRALDYIY